ncbi:MAG: hypothetical protein KKF44_03080 [Nanoarchaeota archaeon]|nr:hypothetical protein [Nanoarchaeota archaeon]
MKYKLKEFNEAVNYYKKELKKVKPTNIYVHGMYEEKAFLSIAPLSRAAHDLKIDMFVSYTDRKEKNVLFDVWKAFKKIVDKNKDQDAKVLDDFISIADKKANGKIRPLFRIPDVIIEAGETNFKGSLKLDYQTEWFVSYKEKKLDETAKAILVNVINPQKEERVGVTFALVPASRWEEPLEDYLDSYAITKAVVKNAAKKHKILRIGAATQRKSMLDSPEAISELNLTLLGCEYCKETGEQVFKAFKMLSEVMNLSRIEPNNAIFQVRGKGYHGRHHFGENIGYPTPDGKSRWDSVTSMLYKFPWYPQTEHDSRDPSSRIGFTETVPIDVFIDSVLIDYKEMRAKNAWIKALMDKSEKIVVKSHIKEGCNFEVGLVKKDGSRRQVKGSDSDARYLIDPKEKKLHVGMMANIPGGEAFTTPEWVEGRIVGDVVISLDRSYMLSAKNPIVIDVKKNKYKILSGQKKILDKLDEKKKDAWNRLLEQERTKSVPAAIVKMKKDNFNNIGEFAINTNPKARLCDYLIVNEKIADMIHIALGSGFEADRASEYHTDIVIDSPRQKLDIYGVDKKGHEYWIIRKGRMAV